MTASGPAVKHRGAAAVAVAVAVAVVLAGGCTPAVETSAKPSTEALTSVELADGTVVVLDGVPTAGHPHYSIEVLTGGVVGTTAGGCWAFEDSRGGHRVAVWPATTTPLADGTGIDVPGHGPVRVGDEVHASARGYLGEAPPWQEEAGLPAACRGEAGITALTGFG